MWKIYYIIIVVRKKHLVIEISKFRYRKKCLVIIYKITYTILK